MKSNNISINNNIHYSTSEIVNYFSINRISWEQFYASEKYIIEKSDIDTHSKVLDFGCACGGLGLALKEKYFITNYTGIDINQQAVEVAKILNPTGKFINIDLLEVAHNEVVENYYDYVFSLSCIDWNVEFDKMLQKVFSFVKPSGDFIVSLRLTLEDSIKDVSKSYQYINYKNKKHGEIAPYVILNINDIIRKFNQIADVVEITGYGYWGKPSTTVITPYNQIFFAVFSLKKGSGIINSTPSYNLDFPNDFLETINFKIY